MKRALPWCLPLALMAAGCAESELVRAPTPPSGGVVMSNQEPGSCCQPLAAVEVHSHPYQAPTGETLRDYALAHGANYVVLESFGVFDELVLARARLFTCPQLAGLGE
jgi:hypothetical protein